MTVNLLNKLQVSLNHCCQFCSPLQLYDDESGRMLNNSIFIKLLHKEAVVEGLPLKCI